MQVTPCIGGRADRNRNDGRRSVGLELRASARLSTLEDGSIVRRIATRYLGPEEGERYAVTAGDDLLIRLEPGERRAWDFADYFA